LIFHPCRILSDYGAVVTAFYTETLPRGFIHDIDFIRTRARNQSIVLV
jgi:hypothetical protein